MTEHIDNPLGEPDAATELQNHPIRGMLWGLVLGIGLAIVLVLLKVISLDLTAMIIVVLVGTLVGAAWGMVGPARPPQGPAPTRRVPVAHESSRFDDFDPPEPSLDD